MQFCHLRISHPSWVFLCARMVDLEEGSGTEENDTELLEKACSTEILEEYTRYQKISVWSNNFFPALLSVKLNLHCNTYKFVKVCSGCHFKVQGIFHNRKLKCSQSYNITWKSCHHLFRMMRKTKTPGKLHFGCVYFTPTLVLVTVQIVVALKTLMFLVILSSAIACHTTYNLFVLLKSAGLKQV